jgi:hypothetical protein
VVLDGNGPEWAGKGSFDPRHAGLDGPGRVQLREDRGHSVDVDPARPLAFLEDKLGGAPLLEGG